MDGDEEKTKRRRKGRKNGEGRATISPVFLLLRAIPLKAARYDFLSDAKTEKPKREQKEEWGKGGKEWKGGRETWLKLISPSLSLFSSLFYPSLLLSLKANLLLTLTWRNVCTHLAWTVARFFRLKVISLDNKLVGLTLAHENYSSATGSTRINAYANTFSSGDSRHFRPGERDDPEHRDTTSSWEIVLTLSACIHIVSMSYMYTFNVSLQKI